MQCRGRFGLPTIQLNIKTMGPLLVFFWCPGRTELSTLRPAHQIPRWTLSTSPPAHPHKHKIYVLYIPVNFYNFVCVFFSVDTPKLVSDHQKCVIRQAERASLSPDVWFPTQGRLRRPRGLMALIFIWMRIFFLFSPSFFLPFSLSVFLYYFL